MVPPKTNPIDDHNSKIDEVLQQLCDVVQDADFNPNDLRCSEILKAKYDQLKELRNQLRVYEAVMGRAQDYPTQKIRYHLKERESYRFRGCLPAFGERGEIDEHIDKFDASNRFLIVQGQTGSGKSTQLPQYIADHPRMFLKKVICTQPRKIAAISLAKRVNLEYAYGSENSEVGFQVGYSVGGSKPIISKKTIIEFMTEGKMLERLMNRREEDFKNVGAIIIDEAHERSIVCDILFGMLKKDDPLWKNILIVVSSATIDLEAFEKFFDHRAKVIKIAGRMYPVERIYKPLPEHGDIIKVVAETALEIHNSSETGSGDILCFLPGADEVHKGAVWFESHQAKSSDLLPAKVYQLYGAQDAVEQSKVFEILDPKVYGKVRKVIFATDIAETSITINGVVYVIDSGVKKEMTYDPKRNISSLKTINISRSSSLQREGRAGRTQPGVCYKLYSEEDFQKMNENTLPEIFRRPLPLAILYLRKMGVDPIRFEWITAPDVETIKSAEEELIVLGAIEPTNKQPTALGGLISLSQQDPKVVRMIYKGMQKGTGMAAIKIAALLSVSSSFFYDGGKGADNETKAKHNEKRKLLQHGDGDIITMFKLYTAYETEKPNFEKNKKIRSEWLVNNSLNGKAIKTADSIVEDLKFIFDKTEFWKEKPQNLIPSDEDILRLFCSGYFLHAARHVNIKGKGQNRLNYFAIDSEVVGSLHYKASLVKAAKGDGESGIPEWILFDQILKFSEMTVFPLSSRIDLNWIEKENNDFYNKCLIKQSNLPTEVVEIEASDTILRTVLGKRLENLSRFEEELKCSLTADLSAGLLRALCSSTSLSYVERTLTAEVERVKQQINNETLEITWLENTRLVIGSGYEVKSILFPKEFSTIYLRNLSQGCTRTELESFVYSKVGDSKKISSIQLIPQERSCMGIIKLIKSDDAAWLLNELKGEVNSSGKDLSVAPHLGDVSTRSIPRAEDVKLKISWALGPSTGEATIILETCWDGNKVVDELPHCFDGARAFAVGDSNLTDLTNKKPKVCEVPQGIFRFCEDTNYTVQPIYKVKVQRLPKAVDEIQIVKQLERLGITPLRVFIKRKEETFSNFSLSALGEEREAKLAPFRATSIGRHKEVVTTDFFDKKGGRAGIIIHHPDSLSIEKIFPQLEKDYWKMTEHMQPYRVELERLFTFSVQVDLYQCFKSKFKKALAEIKKWGVWVSETGPGTGNKTTSVLERKLKFVFIKLRHSDAFRMRLCRHTLEAIIERVSLDTKSSPNFENLFTWTGRLLMKELIPASSDHYIHWDNRNRHIYIYGEDPANIKRKLNTIIELIEDWKKAGSFEVALMLDQRTLERIQKETPNFIDSMCQGFGYQKGQYHLIGKNKLVISTSHSDELQNFQKALEVKGVKMLEERRPPMMRDSKVRYCAVCTDKVQDEFMVTSNCNHAFCMDCIQGMFVSATTGGVEEMPLRCTTHKCEKRLPIQDIMKAAPPQLIQKLNEVALRIYMQSDTGATIKKCPKPNCEQIFRTNKAESGVPMFYACDHCLTDFCLVCTEFLGKDVRAHPNLPCEAARIGEDDRSRKLMNLIRNEILSLCCPRCKEVYFDYDGCAALRCSKCRAGFCALCLQDCGEDAHAHVAGQCPYNNTGDYFSTSVKEGNRLCRIKKLKKFFQDTPDFRSSPDLKSKILNALSRDLSDLNIKISDI